MSVITYSSVAFPDECQIDCFNGCECYETSPLFIIVAEPEQNKTATKLNGEENIHIISSIDDKISV